MKKLDLSDTRDRNIGRILQLQAESAGDTVYLMRDDRRVTFAETDAIVNRLARGLAGLGVGHGDRVAFFMGSAIEVVFLTLAVNRLGAIWIPINGEYKGEWLQDSLVASKPKVIVSDTELWPRLAKVIGNAPHDHAVVLGPKDFVPPKGTLDFAELLEHSDAPHDMSRIGYGDVNSILWTSGTTGRSKGVMQSHNVWIFSAEQGVESWGGEQGTTIYSCLPVYNTAVWSTAFFPALVSGLTCGFDPVFSVHDFWDRTRFYEATYTFTLGAMHMYLWNQPEREDDADNPIRRAGMVPMPDSLIGPFCERFGIEGITQGFGQSEVTGVCNRPLTNKPAEKPGILGKAKESMAVRLLDDAGNEVPVGEVGEFAVMPTLPHIMFEGYFENPQANAEAFTENGWYRMGDLGRMDEDGYFYFVDRKKDAVRLAGRNISTMEVEMAFRKHPAVREVAAYGLPSEELEAETELAVAIIPKPEYAIDLTEMAQFINDNAPYYFVPRYMEIVDSLPYTPTNKVQKYKLRERGVTEAMWDRKKAGFERTR